MLASYIATLTLPSVVPLILAAKILLILNTFPLALAFVNTFASDVVRLDVIFVFPII